MKTAKKNFGKICSILLCQTMVLSGLSFSALAEESDSGLYIAGVQVTQENAADIFGDGTASYDSETGTLTLNDAQITVNGTTDSLDWLEAGIYCENYLNLELNGTNRIEIEDTDSSCFGIYTEDGLSVNGEGELHIAAGAITAPVTSDSQLMSVGILTMGALEINGAGVTTAGGDVNFSDKEEDAALTAYSCGIYAFGGINVDFGGSLSANAGQVTADNSFSFGILANTENICVYDAALEAAGGDCLGENYASSAGICTVDSGFYVYEAGANVSLGAGEAAGAEARSNGLYISGGDLGIDAGTVHIAGGTGEGNCTAVYAEAYENEDGSKTGGFVNLAEFESSGTQVTFEAQNGIAVYAESGIDVLLTLSVPENGEVAGQGEFDEATYFWEYYTVVDANGDAAVTVQTAPEH